MSFFTTSNKGSGESLVSSVMPIKIEGERIILLDQRKIPENIEYYDATNLDDMCFAIKEMVVRGAPSIGVAGALGVAFHGKQLAKNVSSTAQFIFQLKAAATKLEATRPTAVNLRWGVERIFNEAERLCADKNQPVNLDLVADRLCQSATTLIDEHFSINKTLSDFGAELVGKKAGVLTHCNAGSLATCGWGTALGVILSARLKGCDLTVYVPETRPRQQGMRLTAWELVQDGFEPYVITDTMIGYLMAQGKVDLVVVGADRIATNGDTANKIGTYNIAVLANAHKIPFYVAAPLSTIDPHINSGDEISIEERSAEEVTTMYGQPVCPPGVKVLNPAFDVTPAHLIAAIITEAGILREPYQQSISHALAHGNR